MFFYHTPKVWAIAACMSDFKTDQIAYNVVMSVKTQGPKNFITF